MFQVHLSGVRLKVKATSTCTHRAPGHVQFPHCFVLVVEMGVAEPRNMRRFDLIVDHHVQKFRGVLVFAARRLLYHST